jgi:hypothetical protein
LRRSRTRRAMPALKCCTMHSRWERNAVSEHERSCDGADGKEEK